MLCGGKRMEGLLFGELANESQGGPNILSSDIVLALNFFKCHAACQAADHDRDWHARAPDHGLSVVDGWVDKDAVLSSHNVTR
jgi:hypothetical protein